MSATPNPERAPVPGLDLRLVPAAAATWAVVAALVRAGGPAAPHGGAALSLATAALLSGAAWAPLRLRPRRRGAAGRVGRVIRVRRGAAARLSAAMAAVAAAAGAASTGLRQWAAARHPLTGRAGGLARLTLELTGAPRATEHGAAAEAAVPGLPGRVPLFGDAGLLAHDQGTRMGALVAVREGARASVNGLALTLRGEPAWTAPPTGFAARVREGLADIAAGLPAGPDALVPAMVLGDERGFGPGYRRMMADSGLAHLTAVSGANVALVAGAAAWAAGGAGPRARVAAGMVALAGFLAVVGTEPSVLRAMVTGVVGLLAVLLGRRGQAVPALAFGVVVLLVAAPDLAVAPGFMLSVAATAGLVLLAEPVAARLVTLPTVARWPAPAVRAVAVALTAHVTTAPVLAATVGRVPHIAVAANLLAAPAVAPVTVFGMAAAALVGVHATWPATVLVWLAAPFAWWVHAIGGAAAELAGGGDGGGVVGAALICAAFAAFLARPRAVAGVAGAAGLAAAVALAAGLHHPVAPPGWAAAACPVGGEIRVVTAAAAGPGEPAGLDRRCRRALRAGGAPHPGGTMVVADLAAAQELDGRAGLAWILVADCGRRARARIRTPSGIPVACPLRDGPVALYPAGPRIWSGRGTMEP